MSPLDGRLEGLELRGWLRLVKRASCGDDLALRSFIIQGQRGAAKLAERSGAVAGRIQRH